MTAAHPGFPYLTVLVLLPAAGAAIVALSARAPRRFIEAIGLISSVATLGFAITVAFLLHAKDGGYQLVSDHVWAKSLGISWYVGVDGISIFLVVLAALLFPIVLLGTRTRHDVRSYVGWMLLLEAACIGSFISLDLIMFFLFFELTLVPAYFIIAGFGYQQRAYAAVKFFLYTFLGSAFLLVGILTVAFLHQHQTGVLTFSLPALEHTHFSSATGILLFLAFTAAFAVKAPLFPFHTWSPDAYKEAPTGGSIILAAVLAKLGTYGILRFDLNLFPQASKTLAPLLLTLAVIGILYGAVVASAQRDMKRLIAYSSLAQVGFIALGTFAFTTQGLTGAVLLMVNHGIITAGLFLLVGWIYERRRTWQVTELKGLQKPAPILAAVFTVVMMASIGLPGLNGFVSEFLILAGTFLTHRWWAVAATAGVVLSALYLLWAYQQSFHGPTDEANANTRDLSWAERAVIAPLILLIVVLGVYPKPVLDRITPSVNRLVDRVELVTHTTQPAVARHGTAADHTHAHRERIVSDALLAATHKAVGFTISLPQIRYLAILPVIIMLGGAIVLLGVASLTPRPMRSSVATTGAVLVSGTSLGFSLWQWADVQSHGPYTAVAHAVVVDGFSVFISILASAAMLVSALVGDGYLRREGIDGPEYQVLALISASGAMLMGQANDLVIVFLGLEILSIALYVLAAFNHRRASSGEASLKYFVLGSFSSAIFVYGIALTYGATGSTNLTQIADFLARNVVATDGLLLAGLALLLVGFAFKIAAVPFHMWTPDVYQGSPSPVTGFMAAIAKVGAFAALLRVFVSTFGILQADWKPVIYALAVVTLLLGAIVALVQRDIKRMLAYSSINHAGFILLGLQAGTVKGVSGALYYLFAYSFMTIGTFAIVTVLGGKGDGNHDISRYRGLAGRQPLLALSLAVLLLAQAGAPFTTGFLAKLQVVSAAIDVNSVPLAVIAMFSAAIAAFFYLRVAVLMYTPKRSTDAAPGVEPIEGPDGAPDELPTAPVSTAPLSTAAFAPRHAKAEPEGPLPVWAGSDLAVAATTRHNADLLLDDEADTAPVDVAEPDADEVGEPEEWGDERVPVPAATAVAIGLCVAVTVVFGIIPGPLVDFAHSATLLFFP